MKSTSPVQTFNAHLLSAACFALALIIAHIANSGVPQALNTHYPDITQTAQGLLLFLSLLGSGAGLFLLVCSLLNGTGAYRVSVGAACLLAASPIYLLIDTANPYFAGIALGLYMLAGIYSPVVSEAFSRRNRE